MVFFPIIAIFVTGFYFAALTCFPREFPCNWLFCFLGMVCIDGGNPSCGDCFFGYTFITLVKMPIAIATGLCLGVVAGALGWVPVFIFLLIRIIRMIFA